MQLWRVSMIALVAATAAASGVSAKTLHADEGPAELPPAGYTANQYVDSRGCVYVRAGYAGQVAWVPRVTRDRKVLCGFKPSLAGAKPSEAEPKVAATPAPAAAAAKPSATPPKAASRVSAPRASAAPAQTVPARAVKAEARPGSAKPVAKVAAAPARRVAKKAAPAPVALPRRVIRSAPVKMPAGYAPAWKDDRLNPMRGKGTAEGKAQMDMVWSETVPRRLIAAPAARRASGRVSTKGAPQAGTAASHRYVQVGLFGLPANAKAAKARLRALGLPVAVARSRSKGREAQIVFAGPFATQAQLNSALGAVRKAGYGDAFPRK
jgi:hypothetical protein